MSGKLSTYQQALEFLYNRINYERVQGSAYSAGDFKLNRMRGLLQGLGNPQDRIPVVHIAGTKGKGSTAVMIASILRAAGYRVGLFTSPHISRFEERMTVNGSQPSESEIVELVNELLEPVAELDQELGGMNPTYFEITTAMAWQYFAQQQADIVVLEVGLGGRLDATNVCRPEACVITSISRDHTHLLGSEVQQIAREKAGIIKAGIPVISGVVNSPARDEIEDICQQRQAPLRQLECDFHYHYIPGATETSIGGELTLVLPTSATVSLETAAQGATGSPSPLTQSGHASTAVQTPSQFLDKCGDELCLDHLPLPLLGAHQAHNAALAVRTAIELAYRGWKIDAAAIRVGLKQVIWPARIEVVRRDPLTIVDAAHNWASISALNQTLDQQFAGRPRVAIFAATQDKDVQGMLRQLLPSFEIVILTCYQSNPRSVPVEVLYAMSRLVSDRHAHLCADPRSAWTLANRLVPPGGLICVTGSFFIAAEIRELITVGNI